MKILLTGAGRPAGRALSRQLSGMGHKVIGVDTHPVPSDCLDAFEPLPPASDPRMVDALLEIVGRHGIGLIIPTVSAELPVVADAQAAGRFRGVRVVIAQRDSVRTAHDSYLTMQCLDRAEVNVPDYGLPSSYRDAEAVFDSLGEMIMIKPRFSHSHRGIRLVSRGQEDLTQLDDSLLLQSYAPGAAFTPMLYLPYTAEEPTVEVVEKTPSAGRHPSDSLIRPKLAARDRDIVNTALAAGSALGLHGPVKIDIRRAANGTPQVLKVRARFSSSSRLFPGLLDSVLRDYFPPPTGLLTDQMEGIR